MIYSFSSSSCCREQQEFLSGAQKAAILADAFFSLLAVMALTYVILHGNGVNLGPLNSVSSHLGVDGLKILMGTAGGLLALESLAAIISSCKQITKLQKGYATLKDAAVIVPSQQPEPIDKAIEIRVVQDPELANEVQRLRERPDITKEQLDQLQHQNRELETTNQELRKKLENAEAASKLPPPPPIGNIPEPVPDPQLLEQVRLLRLRPDITEQDWTDLQQKNRDLQATVEDLKKRAEITPEGLAQLNQQSDELKTTLNRLEQEFSREKELKKQENESSKDLKEQIEKLKRELGEANAEKSRLQFLASNNNQRIGIATILRDDLRDDPKPFSYDVGDLGDEVKPHETNKGNLKHTLIKLDIPKTNSPAEKSVSTFGRLFSLLSLGTTSLSSSLIEENWVMLDLEVATTKALIEEMPQIMKSLEEGLKSSIDDPEQFLQLSSTALTMSRIQTAISGTLYEEALEAARLMPPPSPSILSDEISPSPAEKELTNLKNSIEQTKAAQTNLLDAIKTVKLKNKKAPNEIPSWKKEELEKVQGYVSHVIQKTKHLAESVEEEDSNDPNWNVNASQYGNGVSGNNSNTNSNNGKTESNKPKEEAKPIQVISNGIALKPKQIIAQVKEKTKEQLDAEKVQFNDAQNALLTKLHGIRTAVEEDDDDIDDNEGF